MPPPGLSGLMLDKDLADPRMPGDWMVTEDFQMRMRLQPGWAGPSPAPTGNANSCSTGYRNESGGAPNRPLKWKRERQSALQTSYGSESGGVPCRPLE
ncbi:hypothetical protein GJAV_G00129210 [Gymnothorax javanicus]|nr:hypothetical protein GJAV_G00129210 [Gymnothorax javanicus]